jgi:hypothetical protein
MWTPVPGSPQARALAHVAARSGGSPIDPSLRVTLQFHPDRLHDGTPILRSLASAGVYRSQFETGTSNGGLTAHPGGDRWNWESRIFGTAYDDAPPAERPKYGSLNFRGRATGGAPRFGSAYFRLKPEVLLRTTFCYPDSAYEPADFGVADRMSLIPLAEHDDRRDQLDWSIEAHVHGPVRLALDVEALVLDPSYRDTDTEVLARELPCPIEWHPGFLLSIEELRRYPEYRGPQYVDLGIALARDGELTPALIGAAARAGCHDSQDLKKVWHYVARFGDLTAAGDGQVSRLSSGSPTTKERR